VPPGPAAAAPVDPARRPRPPKDAQGALRLTVLDARTGAPVPQAKVSFLGLRRDDEPAAEYLWDGDAPSVETDVHGVARIPFPAWVHGLAPTQALDTTVVHPDYITFRGDLKVESLEQDATVRLERGAILIVSGWIGAPSNVVRDVKPQMDDDAGLDAESWRPMRDGRPSTNRLAPGPHALAISWRGPEGALWHSRVEVLEIAPGEQREIALELLPAVTLVCQIDPAVPRPVLNGQVEISMDFGPPHGATALRTWTTGVAPDGTFRVEELPQGTGELIALCDGWVCKREIVQRKEEGLDPGTERHNPRVVVPLREPLTVPMEPTATLVVRTVDAAGAPVPGARVDVWPNVVWSNGYSSLFLGRTWSASTDATGAARLENLPPAEGQGLAVNLEGWSRAQGQGPHPDQLQVRLISGETAELRVVLERNGG
jgi:hypothetical protein